ncbi:MAG: sigma-70 family RNA polymerase sigma factor [Bacteroidetes bacterium]|nr:sigma-70 family RNA polymerase sigma factor [Bacteroidota bacterium]
MRQLKITNQITNRNSDSLEKYLYEIGKIDLLNSEEEVELAKKIRNGDQAALDRLTRANLRFVVSVAKQYQNQGLSLADLINEGNLGLIKAAQRFDETKGFKFISYAVWWIRQSIMQAIVEQSRLVRLPLNKVGSFNRYHRTCAQLEQELGREATQDEVAVAMGITVEDLREILKNNTRYLSVDAPIGGEDEEGTMLDLIKSGDDNEPDFELMDVSLRQHIKEALSVISEREALIVSCYYGLNGETPFTLEEIGSKFDLTRERVRQIKERAIRRLRRATASKELRNYL